MTEMKSETRDGMRIEWDAPIEMDDGVVLRCDVFRPVEERAYPAILSYSPYGKWLLFGDYYVDQWTRMCAEHPDVPAPGCPDASSPPNCPSRWRTPSSDGRANGCGCGRRYSSTLWRARP